MVCSAVLSNIVDFNRLEMCVHCSPNRYRSDLLIVLPMMMHESSKPVTEAINRRVVNDNSIFYSDKIIVLFFQRFLLRNFSVLLFELLRFHKVHFV